MPHPVTVRLSPLLKNLFPAAEMRLELQVASVAGMIAELNARWPGMADRICDSTPAIRRHMNIFVNGQRVKLESALAPGADVFILTAVSGG